MHCTHCPRPVQARGLCNTHYHQARRDHLQHGAPMPARATRSYRRTAPALCRYRACATTAYLHTVCLNHLVDTLAAGRRATTYIPRRRLDQATTELSAAA